MCRSCVWSPRGGFGMGFEAGGIEAEGADQGEGRDDLYRVNSGVLDDVDGDVSGGSGWFDQDLVRVMTRWWAVGVAVWSRTAAACSRNGDAPSRA